VKARLPRNSAPAPSVSRQQDQAAVELGDQHAIGGQNAQPLHAHDRRHRAEHRQRRDRHDIAGDLQHQRHHRIGEIDDDAALLTDGRKPHAREDREDQKLQHIVLRHGVQRAGRENLDDEVAQGELAGGQITKPVAGLSARPAPGWNRLTSTMPSSSDTRLELTNQISALPPMRPSAVDRPCPRCRSRWSP
jgi:hypothetical protein